MNEKDLYISMTAKIFDLSDFHLVFITWIIIINYLSMRFYLQLQKSYKEQSATEITIPSQHD